MNWFKNTYGNVSLLVRAEAGYDLVTGVSKSDRTDYHRDYVNQVLKGNRKMLTLVKNEVDFFLY